MFSVQQIKFEIMRYVSACGGNFSDWSIGITNDPRVALFKENGVNEDEDYWLSKQAVSFRACYTIMKYFTEVQNMDGYLSHFDNCDVNEEFDCIYIYKKNP